MDSATGIPHVFTRRFLWAGYLIGFALGGFFDGIVLHQILQWHHLLSGVGAAGLWMLYRSRVLWSDRAGAVWVMSAARDVPSTRYYRHGAMYVSGTLLPSGCAAWTRTAL